MNIDEEYIKRCIEIANSGIGFTAPNPMVGAVIVYNNKIIGEGFHKKYGGAHAEVNAINSVKNKSLLKDSVLYINLEPCSHFGKTPPCSDLIIKYKIPRIVIGSKDTHRKVNGIGIENLKKSGCNVTVGILEKECRELNKFFFTFHEKNRPYIILKWAQTSDGFIDIIRGKKSPQKPTWITDDFAQIINHKWRAETQSIIVGTNTAINDNPKLNVRKWKGNNPLRIVIDRDLSLPETLNLFDGTISTLVFTEKQCDSKINVEYCVINFEENIINQILETLYIKKIQSLIVEGGAKTLNSFIKENLWDEARVFIADKYFKNGINAPVINQKPVSKDNINGCNLYIYRNV